MIDSHIREFFRHLLNDFIPHYHPISLSITLRNVSEQLSRSVLSDVECKLCDSTNASSSKDGQFYTV